MNKPEGYTARPVHDAEWEVYCAQCIESGRAEIHCLVSIIWEAPEKDYCYECGDELKKERQIEMDFKENN
jgi:hypothetical protein